MYKVQNPQNILKFIAGLTLVLMFIFIVPTNAQTPHEPLAHPDLRTNPIKPEDIQACGECHGENGLPKDKKLPILWGQDAFYLEKQLRDYRSGQRENQIMTSMAEGIAKEKIRGLALSLSQKPWPIAHSNSNSTVDLNSSGNSVSQEEVQVCLSCHAQSTNGEMVYKGSPRILGQNAEYLLDQMLAWVNQDRNNSELMGQILQNKSKQQLQALSNYFAQH
jgi:cytochrome c553